jgi:hypothetical protein
MASIKRPLSRENTSPSQKMMSFFCRDIIQYEISPLSLPASGFSKFIGADSYSICCQAPIRIKASEVAIMLKNFGWTVDVLADPGGATLRSKLNRLVTGPGRKREKAILVWYQDTAKLSKMLTERN